MSRVCILKSSYCFFSVVNHVNKLIAFNEFRVDGIHEFDPVLYNSANKAFEIQ